MLGRLPQEAARFFGGMVTALLKIIKAMGSLAPAEVKQLCHEEDGEPYSVWRIIWADKTRTLKEAKEYEPEIYLTFLKIVSRLSIAWQNWMRKSIS